jgi:hypothetical protein
VTNWIPVQWLSEYLSSPVFKWSFCVLKWNGPIFELLWLSYFRSVFQITVYIRNGRSGIRMVNSRTLFWSGYRMVVMTASLDRFGIKNILFMTLFFIKRSRLGPTIRKPDLCPGFEL